MCHAIAAVLASSLIVVAHAQNERIAVPGIRSLLRFSHSGKSFHRTGCGAI
jgi:hypothetical protein